MTNIAHKHLLITRGFLLAGAYNIFGILVFSKFLTSPSLSSIDPDTFSRLGQIAIILWGIAYLSVAKSYQHVPLLILTFAIEKLLYSFTWLNWIYEKWATIPAIAEDSLLAAIFYSVYGIGDIASCIFFSWVAASLITSRTKSGA